MNAPRNPQLFTNAVLVLVLFALLGLYALMADLDARTINSPEAQQSKREWDYAKTHCLRMYGPGAEPEFDAYGHIVCRTTRGQRILLRPLPGGQQRMSWTE